MPNYTKSEEYKKDKILLLAFSSYANEISVRFNNPLMAPKIIEILWERRMEFKKDDMADLSLNYSSDEPFDVFLDRLAKKQ